MSCFIVKIGVGRSSSDTLNYLETYVFSSFLGGERRSVPFSCFQALKDLSADPVDLFETVPVSFGGLRYLFLVDEEGLVRDEPDPLNLSASLACGCRIFGDVFVVRADPPEMLFLDDSDVKTIYSEFSLFPSEPVLVELPSD